MDREELAWCAGLVDGEGSFVTTYQPAERGRHGNRQMFLRVAQSSMNGEIPEVLIRIELALDLGAVRRVQRRRDGRRPAWTYEIGNFEHVQAAVAMLWCWLSPVKRDQATRMLRSYLMLDHLFAPRRARINHRISNGIETGVPQRLGVVELTDATG